MKTESLSFRGLSDDDAVRLLDKYLSDLDCGDIGIIMALMLSDLSANEANNLLDKYLDDRGSRNIGFTFDNDRSILS